MNSPSQPSTVTTSSSLPESSLSLFEPLANLSQASELADYQTEPVQMPAGAVGKYGRLVLKFKPSCHHSKTELNYLYRQAPLLVQRALYNDDGLPTMPVCNIISVGGGMLQGDRNQIDIHVAAHASAHITTQGATRIQQMDANYALQHQHIELENGAYLEYLPDFTIPYKNARFISQTDMLVHPNATLLYGEIFMGGRKYHKNERFEFDLLSIKNRVYQSSMAEKAIELKFCEKILYQQSMQGFDSPSIMANFDVFANVLLITPSAHVDEIKAKFIGTFDKGNACAYGVSLLPSRLGLVLRVVGQESYQVKAVVKDFWQQVRQSVKHQPLSRAKMNPFYQH